MCITRPGRQSHSYSFWWSLLASICLLILSDTDKQVGSRVELKLNTLSVFARHRIALEHFLCCGRTAERDTSQELVKQPLQIFVKPVSLASLLLGPKETGIKLVRDQHLLASTCQVSLYQSSDTHGRRSIIPEWLCPGPVEVPAHTASHLVLPTPKGLVEQGNAQSPALTVTWEARKPVLASSRVDNSK